MPIQWNLRQWLASNRQIYRPSELRSLLEEKAGTQLSWQAISSLLNTVPSALRLSTIQALCNALNCNLSDFFDVLPDQHPSTISVLIPAWVWSISPDLTHGIIDAITESSYDISLYSISDNEKPKSA
ncbi:MAG TPA: helix-turn-helix transcriptional regulator, partial [Ktedonosporobacter sp.]|nr:helix-turn-helix transcriptional regulator [Ktedonosporobacter sp.]